MKDTNAIYKLLQTLVNISVTFVLSVPVIFFFGFGTEWKISWIFIFLIYNLVFEIFVGRCLGMIIFKTRYDKESTLKQKILYSLLYTMSFSTALFYLWIPYDILIFNLLFLQLPTIFFTGTTLHGLMSGGVKTVWIGA